ncbi:hypothetical protein NQ317_013249 [Molorchus minor]|uniref:Uncharacterized protein n=1 Tax=Molorchus minor TaxID=1323400 RepID=A0ABQ9JY76_9CUCU|nr:hypothetical protein NQ317_013249 [Molorchus minor]
MVYDVKGKIALITGGATGIGLDYSMQLLKNGLKGVVISDIDTAKGGEAVNKITKEFGSNKAVFITTDVTKVDQLEAAFKMAISTFGTLDIVINNAGILNDADWELQIAINCLMALCSASNTWEKTTAGRGGVIVNIASVLGLQELSGCPVYIGTKHFVIGLDRSFGTPYFYNKTGIKYLTMCPGITDTPLISEAGKFALQMFPDLGKVLHQELQSFGVQPISNVSKGMVSLITNGENGSIYIAEGNEPAYGVQLPDRKTFKRGVVIADTNAAKGEEAVQTLNKSFGENKAVFIKTDVTKLDQLEAAFNLVISKYSTLDIVINNAGIMNDAHYELEIAINVAFRNNINGGSPRILTRNQVHGKEQRGKGGVIVNIASILGLQKLAGCPIYVGTKHFVVGLDRSFGTPYFYDLTGIRFLTMCPGVTDTPLISRADRFALQGYPGLGQLLAQELGALPAQPPANVAKGMFNLITQGENGSVWVSEGNEPAYEVQIPDRKSIRKN